MNEINRLTFQKTVKHVFPSRAFLNKYDGNISTSEEALKLPTRLYRNDKKWQQITTNLTYPRPEEIL